MINRLNNRDYTVTLALRTGFGSVDSCILTLRPVIVCLSVTRATDHCFLEGHEADVWYQVSQAGRLLGQSNARNADISGAARHLIRRGS